MLKIFEEHFIVFKVFSDTAANFLKLFLSPWIKSVPVWILTSLFLLFFYFLFFVCLFVCWCMYLCMLMYVDVYIFSLLFVCLHVCMYLYVYAPVDVLKCWYFYYIFLLYVQLNISTSSVNMMYYSLSILYLIY